MRMTRSLRLPDFDPRGLRTARTGHRLERAG
jgi:hypothetical protein